MASPTYTLIASNTVSGSTTTTVTFSSIPSTYTDLVLKISARTDASSTVDGLTFTFNGVGGTSYSYTGIRGSGSAALSSRTSNDSFFNFSQALDAATATSNTFSSIEIYIPSYTASQNKPLSTFTAQENNNATAYIWLWAGLFSNTSSISSISFTPVNGPNFVSGSTFYLYGIKNA